MFGRKKLTPAERQRWEQMTAALTSEERAELEHGMVLAWKLPKKQRKALASELLAYLTRTSKERA